MLKSCLRHYRHILSSTQRLPSFLRSLAPHHFTSSNSSLPPTTPESKFSDFIGSRVQPTMKWHVSARSANKEPCSHISQQMWWVNRRSRAFSLLLHVGLQSIIKLALRTLPLFHNLIIKPPPTITWTNSKLDGH